METIAQLAPGEKIKHKGGLTIEENVGAENTEGRGRLLFKMIQSG